MNRARVVILITVILGLLVTIFITNPGDKIKFWQKKSVEKRFEEIEELLPDDKVAIESKTEEPLISDLEDKKSPEETGGTGVLKDMKPSGPVEGLDIFEDESFTLELEKTEDEKKKETIESLIIQGKTQIERGNFADAAATFTQIIKLDPTNEDATNYLYIALSNLRQSAEKGALSERLNTILDKARLLYEEKDYTESLKEFQKIIELDPGHIIAQEYIKKITEKLSGEEAKKEEERRRQEEETKRLAEENRKKIAEEMRWKTPRLLKEAESHIATKDYDKAIRIYRDILEFDPYNEKVQNLLKDAEEKRLEEEGKIAEAKEEIEAKERLLGVDKASIPVTPEQEATYTKEGKPTITEKPKEVSPTLRKISALREKAQQLVSLDFENADLRDVLRFLVEQTQVNIVIDESVLKELVTVPAQASGMMMPQGYLQPGVIAPQEEKEQDFPAGEEKGESSKKDAMLQGLTGTYAMPQGMPGISEATQKEPISPKVTIYLINVPLEKALDMILRSKGLTYKIEEEIIWVSTKERLEHEEMKVEVFTLKQALGRFKDFAAKPLSTGKTGGGTEKEEGYYDLFGGTSSKSKGKKEEDLWSLEIGGEEEPAEREQDIRDIIMQFVPQPEGSAVAYYEKVAKLLVRNTPTNIEMVREILKSLDVSTYQVSIEARLIEVSSFKGEDIGVSWENVKVGFGDEPKDSIEANLTHEPVTFGKDENIIGGLTLKYATLDAANLEATLSALLKTKKANMLSAPKLTCLNNQTANIRIVTNHKYVSRWEFSTSGYDQYTREFWTPVIADLDEGIVLDVTPHVNDENMTITLVVKPTVNELIEFEQIGDAEHPNQLPQTTVRSAETTVSIKNGQTLVLGGLMKNEDVVNKRGVPVLGSIPIIGRLFRQDTKHNMKSDLIIFITGTILSSEGHLVADKLSEPTNLQRNMN